MTIRGTARQSALPSTPAEVALASIWADVLKVQDPGIHDNFFSELGGHSLLAVQVVSRIRRALEVDLPLRVLFEFPTIHGLAAHLALLDRRPTLSIPMPPSVLEHAPPLSPAQQRLWFLDQFEDLGAAYHIFDACRLVGSLNLPALESALRALTERHDSLRTRFSAVDGLPQQVVDPTICVPLQVEDLGKPHAPQHVDALSQILQQERDRPFDLIRGPLLRTKLLKLDDCSHILLRTWHHLIVDGWSLGLLNRELGELYEAHCQGTEATLPELSLQYVDYSLQQRPWHQGEGLRAELEYWRRQLADAPVLQLRADRPRPARQSFSGAYCPIKIDVSLARQINDFSHRENVTPFMSLLAAFQALLGRYSGQHDVVVGMPVANRDDIELERLVGFLANTVVIRTDLSGEPNLREVVSRVRQVTLEAQQHPHVPFEKLVEELNPPREMNRHPLFQVVFAFQNTPQHSLTLTGLETAAIDTPAGSSRFDLELQLWPRGETWEGWLSYNTDLFDSASIEQLAARFLMLLENGLANPDLPISRVSLLSATEQDRLLVDWNRTATDYPRGQCIHELFQDHAQQNPDAIAVVFQNVQTSYCELNERANRLGHFLRSSGLRPNDLVGVLANRSEDLIISLLGILKAGGAYLPLDASHPPERVRTMLDDAKATIVIAADALPDLLRDGPWKQIDLKADAESIANQSSNNLATLGDAESPAYVMYTSGSTGRPKGAVIPHRGVVRLVRGQRYASFDSGDHFLFLASPAFDASTFELWGALLNGATCVIYPERLPDFEALEKFIRTHNVTCLWLTAGLFNAIIDDHPTLFEGVRQVLTGGEALSVPHVQKALNKYPTLRLTNGYGPTECTTFTSTFDLRPEMTFSSGSVPIGRPIANTRVYILDSHQQPVPIGLPGELYVGGDGVALGYVNHPELTAERFVRDPFNTQTESLLYRTGDICRYLADGNIEFLGRSDSQVKIRGFRIELGEIEARLMEHPQVRQVAVLVREDHPGDKRLAGYIVPQSPDAPPEAAHLRQHLQARLPDYMVPAAFLFLDALPLTRNGKVDHRGLPAPQSERRFEQGRVAPRNAVEKSLATLWCDLLEIELVGVDDNFFELGGHSLLGVQLVERINREFEATLRVIDLFRLPTIGQLGTMLAASAPEHGGDKFLSVFRPPATRGSVVWIGGHFTQLLKVLPADVGFCRLGLDGMDTETFHRFDVDATVERYTAELLQADVRGPLVLAGFSYSGLLAYALALRLRHAIRERIEVALLEPSIPGSIESDAPRSFLTTLRAYCGKLYRGGFGALYQAVKSRLQHDNQELSPPLDSTSAKRWETCLPFFLLNIETYRPPHPLREGVHLVAGSNWLAEYLREFKAESKETPRVYNVSEVAHLDLPNSEACIRVWSRVINEILPADG
jgi:amino acid adenylation domain-containing protein